MEVEQESGVRRVKEGMHAGSYRLVLRVYLTPGERDQWGAGLLEVTLQGKSTVQTYVRSGKRDLPVYRGGGMWHKVSPTDRTRTKCSRGIPGHWRRSFMEPSALDPTCLSCFKGAVDETAGSVPAPSAGNPS